MTTAILLTAAALAAAAPATASDRQGQVAVPPAAASQAPAAEVIADVHVHGNNVTSDADVLALAGVSVGQPFETTTLAAVRDRLARSGRFEDVQVLKRFASIRDPSRIALVIIVNERPARILAPERPGGPARVVARSRWRDLMVLPVLAAEDGYGVTYGARVAWMGGGTGNRVSFPLTWGGDREAAAVLERTAALGPLSRVEAGAGLDDRRNPAFDERDTRGRVWLRGERRQGPWLAGAGVERDHVSFGGLDQAFTAVGADVTFDTRLDPALPRDAVFLQASWARMAGLPAGPIERLRLDARGYVGLAGQTVLVARVARDDANRARPPYLQPLLGGWSTLRGFRAGAFAGDTRVNGLLELRMPLSSPLSVARAGVSVFVDAGASYDEGQRLADQPVRIGAGAGVWLTAAVLRVDVAVAHGRGAGTRVTFGIGTTF